MYVIVIVPYTPQLAPVFKCQGFCPRRFAKRERRQNCFDVCANSAVRTTHSDHVTANNQHSRHVERSPQLLAAVLLLLCTGGHGQCHQQRRCIFFVFHPSIHPKHTYTRVVNWHYGCNQPLINSGMYLLECSSNVFPHPGPLVFTL